MTLARHGVGRMKVKSACVAACAIGLGALPVHAQIASPQQRQPVMAQRELDALVDCLMAVKRQLTAKRVTPERYQMAMSGACMDQERAMLAEVERDLTVANSRYPSATEPVVQQMRTFQLQFRAEQISMYTVWYETTAK